MKTSKNIYETKKTKLLLPLTIILLFIVSSCKKETTIEVSVPSASTIKYFNINSIVDVKSIEKTKDGGFVYSGVDKTNPINSQGFLMKVDSLGKQEWYKTYGGENRDWFDHAIQTSDGGFLAVGLTNSSYDSKISIFSSGYYVKTNSIGEVTWEKNNRWTSNSKSVYSNLFYCAEAPDHSFVATGDVSPSNGYPIAIKIDASGNLKQSKSFPFSSLVNYPPFISVLGWRDWGSFVSFSNDGAIIMAGEMSQNNRSGLDVNGLGNKVPFLAKLNFNDLIPEFYYKYESIENSIDYLDYMYNFNSLLYEYSRKFAPRKVLNLSDGYLIGTFFTTADKKFKMQLIKTNLNGDYLWEKQYAGLGNALLWDIQSCADGNFLMVGSSTSQPYSPSFEEGFSSLKIALIKVDPAGNQLSEMYVGSEQSANVAKCVNQLPDGGFTVAGFTNVQKEDSRKMFWLQLDSKGKILNK